MDKLQLQRTFDSAARRYGTSPTKRLPLTVEILAKIRPLIDFAKHEERAIWAILCVGVFSLARIGELKVTLGSVKIKGDHGTIHLVGTKTDRKMEVAPYISFEIPPAGAK